KTRLPSVGRETGSEMARVNKCQRCAKKSQAQANHTHGCRCFQPSTSSARPKQIRSSNASGAGVVDVFAGVNPRSVEVRQKAVDGLRLAFLVHAHSARSDGFWAAVPPIRLCPAACRPSIRRRPVAEAGFWSGASCAAAILLAKSFFHWG